MTNVRENALPCSSCKGENRECPGKPDSANTDVSRGSITGNLDRSISTPRKFYRESTMSQFRYAEIHEQGCDFSRDLVERATFECFVAIRHLRRSQILNIPNHQWRQLCNTHALIC